MTRFHPPVVKNKRLHSHWLRCLRDKKHLALILRTPWISERLTKEARGTVKCEESICVFNDDWCATPRTNRSQLVTVNPVWICISALDRSSLLLNCALTEYSSITARNVSLSAALVEFISCFKRFPFCHRTHSVTAVPSSCFGSFQSGDYKSTRLHTFWPGIEKEKKSYRYE